MTKTTYQILSQAKELILDPNHWTITYLARTSDGRPAQPKSSEAAQFCAIGALMRAADISVYDTHDNYTKGYMDAAIALARGAHSQPISYINDIEGHEAVLKLYDRAIEEAYREEHPTEFKRWAKLYRIVFGRWPKQVVQERIRASA